jgi:hypothetical protein
MTSPLLKIACGLLVTCAVACGAGGGGAASSAPPEAEAGVDASISWPETGTPDGSVRADAHGGEGGAGCTVVCSTNHVTPTCSGSTCSGTCDPGYADCDGNLQTNGCEVAVGTDIQNCGSCGRACSTSNVGVACSAGVCDGVCNPGFSDCNGNKQADGCEAATGTDPQNCGGCGTVCSADEIAPKCSGGVCDGACAPGYADCNGDKQADGCEVAVETDTNNCGGCNRSCPAPSNADATCSDGVCGEACLNGYGDCNGQTSDGCEANLSGDPTHCGGCANVCSGENVVQPACTSGVCSGACNPGYADCNHNELTDGCETSTSANVSNCGGCGIVCGGHVGRGCTNTVCNPTCDDGVRNQGESDADCGGPCLPCAVGKHCDSNSDCRSGDCSGIDCAAVKCAKGFGLPAMPLVTTGETPRSAAVADVNGDGHLDVVFATWASDTQGEVDVLLGHGDGTFAPKVAYQAGSGSGGVAIGDVNGDSKPDLVVANFYDNTVSVFLNKGSGVFATHVDYAAPYAPTSVALGDLDGDGALDIAVGGNANGVLLNNGTGAFPTLSTYVLIDLGETGIAIGDLDGDGKLDIVSTDEDAVNVLINAGGGVFAADVAYYGGFHGAGIAVADVNGDGKPDVMVSSHAADGTESTVSVWMNHGDGTLAFKVDYDVAVGAQGIVATDLNGDGKPDLAVANGSDGISVLLNQGGGVFGAQTVYLTSVKPSPLASGDFNGDGAPDLVVADQLASVASVLLNLGGAVFNVRADYATPATLSQIALGDLNGDGVPDVVTTAATLPSIGIDGSGDSVSVLLNSGGFLFAPAVSYPTGNVPFSVALGDFNGDEKLDIATVNYSDATVSVLLNKGDGTFAPKTIVPVPHAPGSIVAADFNRDGRADLAVVSPSGLTLLFAVSSGNVAFSRIDQSLPEPPQGDFPQALATGDLNGDGMPDLAMLCIAVALGAGNLPAILPLYNNGSGSFVPQNPVFTTTWNTALLIGKLPGGSTGFVVGNQNATVTIAGVDHATDFNPNALALGDFNGDGISDVAATSSNTLNVFLGTAAGSVQTAVNYAISGGAALAASDINGDGRTDLVAGGGDVVSILPDTCIP